MVIFCQPVNSPQDVNIRRNAKRDHKDVDGEHHLANDLYKGVHWEPFSIKEIVVVLKKSLISIKYKLVAHSKGNGSRQSRSKRAKNHSSSLFFLIVSSRLISELQCANDGFVANTAV
jgi:hypothetical protein